MLYSSSMETAMICEPCDGEEQTQVILTQSLYILTISETQRSSF